MSAARRLRRHWALAVVCAAFLLAGALSLGAYHGTLDGSDARVIGNAALDYLAGDGERAFKQLIGPHDEYYGAVVETPLVLLERALGPGDPLGPQRLRHIPSYLFFLLGGACCYLLVYRLFGSRALALVAMILFLLHPRIYAHSFFNSKDVPFLVLFMIALSLIHRAFRRETLGSFLLCGVGVGLLVNLRVLGLLLFAAVLGLRALDLALASSRGERRRVLLTGGAFALAAMLTYYASLPVLWTDPVGRFPELLRELSAHENATYPLFRGERFSSVDGPPWDYVPVWVAITTPPATLLLAAVGTVALAWSALRRPRGLIHNGPVRFGLMLAALPVVVAVAVVLLENNLYDGWRHLFFLYAPLCLLAVFGIHALVRARRARWMRAGAYALAGAAIAVTVVSMTRIHPQERDYFTLLTDRTTPGRLASTWEVERRPPEHRSGERDFRGPRHDPWCPALPGARVERLYGILLRCVVDPAAYLGGYRRAALAAEPLDRARFDAYHLDDVMVYVRDDCSREDMELRFFLRAHPVTAADPPGRYGFGKRDFTFTRYGARIDGDCVAVVPLPDYPIARIQTGQYTPEYAVAARRAVADAEPRVRARFDVWLDEDERMLTYVREGCSGADMARFFLHVHPVDEADLVEGGRTAHGFDNHDFSFPDHGVRLEDGACVVVVPLPAYPIANIHTGQLSSPETARWAIPWDARFAFSLPKVDPSALAGEPLARGGFDVHRDGDALVYVKEECADADADAAFFLHLYPVDEADLPAAARERGFENRDFWLWERDGRAGGGRCIAVAPLPGYPVAAARTGQYDEDGARWEAGFSLVHGEASSLTGEPLARGGFDVWLDGDALVYVKDECAEDDMAAQFFLHVHPVDADDLPEARREHGFDNRDFLLWQRGGRDAGGRCVAMTALPDYPIASIRTGQYDAAGQLWAVEFAPPE